MKCSLKGRAGIVSYLIRMSSVFGKHSSQTRRRRSAYQITVIFAGAPDGLIRGTVTCTTFLEAASEEMPTVECPAYTRIAEDVELGKNLMKLLPPSESVSRQFITACNILNLQRQEVRRSLDRDCNQQVHRAATQDSLVKYYAHLTTPPLSVVDLARLNVKFKWKDSIGYSKAVRDISGELEKNNLIYNIGVASSYLATEVLVSNRL